MAQTLLNYLTDVQYLLHDSSNQFWLPDELYGYINKGRKAIAAESDCTRTILTKDIQAATTLATATYLMDSGATANNLSTTRRVMDVLDIMLNLTTTHSQPLKFLTFQAATRSGLWQSHATEVPTHYTINNRTIYLLPWPTLAYATSQFDCTLEPVDLATIADSDTDIPFPYTECVSFYAAYLAKLKDQRTQEAEEFFKNYQRRKRMAIGTEFTRRLQDKDRTAAPPVQNEGPTTQTATQASE